MVAVFWMILAFTIGVIAVGRAARLLVHDDFPPAAALRSWWGRHLPEAWQSILWNDDTGTGCPFCMAPYLAAGNLAWIWVAGVEPDGFWSLAWWAVNLWAAGSYLAAILVVRDEPE